MSVSFICLQSVKWQPLIGLLTRRAFNPKPRRESIMILLQIDRSAAYGIIFAEVTLLLIVYSLILMVIYALLWGKSRFRKNVNKLRLLSTTTILVSIAYFVLFIYFFATKTISYKSNKSSTSDLLYFIGIMLPVIISFILSIVVKRKIRKIQ